jgi:hypothetical protein
VVDGDVDVVQLARGVLQQQVVAVADTVLGVPVEALADVVGGP